jgi:flagellar biosynthesis/type III secretory pathway M-ring protein FliF/YscJ
VTGNAPLGVTRAERAGGGPAGFDLAPLGQKAFVSDPGGEMSTLAVIAIVVVALIVVALLISAARRSKRRRELGTAQAEAQHDDVRHHRERADESRTEAAIAEERAKRAKVEAELDEERADARERELSE